MNEKSFIFLVVTITAIVFMCSGILIGYYAIDGKAPPEPPVIDFKQWLIEEVSADAISNNLRYLTNVPHVAGTIRDKEQAEWVRDRFLEAGLDEAQTVPYEVLLSYPSSHGVVNQISLLDEQGKEQFVTVGKQPALGTAEEAYNEVLPNFNAYSVPGVVEGNLVYAYYGREEDYQYLLDRGINVSGHLVLVRYGATFRGSKVQIAEQFGAKGVILYSDPRDKAAEGRNFTYPDSWWLPGKGVESGTVYRGDGDPLTPFYPSIESAYRIDENDDKTKLPNIPVQPIGYDEAEVFLRNISPENSAKPEWVGDLNASYSLGPNPLNPGWKVKMNISTSNKRSVIYDTIGILRGSVEDDRYVLVGNHRDAWTFGALDPSSGTASMVEVVRALGKLKKDTNWRPRRTMVFCSWGAEEYGLIGSYEWTEQNAKALGQRAVAYLNIDVAVSGNKSFGGSAFPTLQQHLIDMSKLVPNPNPEEVAAGKTSLFDNWMANSAANPNKPSQPLVNVMGGGSDFKSFGYVHGVPATDFGFSAPYGYPTYHSLYDNYYLASEIIDKGFVHHQAVARMLAVTATELADAIVLPYDLKAYATYLSKALADLELKYETLLEQNNATFKFFRESVETFKSETDLFQSNLLKLDRTSALEVRKLNDRMMYLERYFTDSRGLPNRPDTNHIVFSVSASNSYASNTFAGLVDLLVKVGNQSLTDDPQTWAQISQHLSVIAFLIGEAARSLNYDLGL